MEDTIKYILVDMDEYLTANQSQKLQRVLTSRLTSQTKSVSSVSNSNYLAMFLNAKKIEGCSERTLSYYKTTVEKLLDGITDPIRKVTTDDIREYLANYQGLNDCSKTTIDNIRRNISSFFTWLEEEDYIIKSPMRRIHKIKTAKTVKEVISDEEIEKMRDKCKNLRDLAIIDLLYSTGIRIGELVRLNIDDIDFEERECIVFGKGDKERRVYFDAKTKIHLMSYINSRFDTNPALFVTLDAPYDRLQISGVEIRLRHLGRELGINKVHPHKFRRTMATRAIDKGMPIEQVQKLLGHSQIDTTMHYAIVNQTNVKVAHRKFIA
jgi:site-specific recombinase xerD